MTPRRDLPYAAFWCEENVWHLCAHPRVAALERHVLVVSSRSGRVATWMQRAAERPEWPVLWDYHVVLLAHEGEAWQIWDLDTTLDLPVAATRWLARSFPPLRREHQAFAPLFRVMRADLYRATLSSDRSHMRDESGRLRAAAPPWPAIMQGESNLLRMTDMRDGWIGDVMTIEQLRAWLAAR